MTNYFGLLSYTLYYYRNNIYRALEPTPAAGLYLPVPTLANNSKPINFYQSNNIIFLNYRDWYCS